MIAIDTTNGAARAWAFASEAASKPPYRRPIKRCPWPAWPRSEHAKSLAKAVQQRPESIPEVISADRRRIIARQVAEDLEDAQVTVHDFQVRHEQDATPLALTPFCNALCRSW
jgi:hypothetical protein